MHLHTIHTASAPPELHEPFRRISSPMRPPHAGTYEAPGTFRLDANAPIRAVRHQDSVEQVAGRFAAMSMDPVSPGAQNVRSGRPRPRPLQHNPQQHQRQHSDSIPSPSSPRPSARVDYGASFEVTWIRVQPLPFTRCKHLRNPWNLDRELKVARDGTELEPNVGAQLLALWDELGDSPQVPATSKKPGKKHGGKGKEIARYVSSFIRRVLDQFHLI